MGESSNQAKGVTLSARLSTRAVSSLFMLKDDCLLMTDAKVWMSVPNLIESATGLIEVVQKYVWWYPFRFIPQQNVDALQCAGQHRQIIKYSNRCVLKSALRLRHILSKATLVITKYSKKRGCSSQAVEAKISRHQFWLMKER